MRPELTLPDRLHSLDVLRGAAALSVVFWHWQHFFFNGQTLSIRFNREEQPLFEVFFLLYSSGSLAVDLFFSLSGFIFFWLYSHSVSRREMPALRFFWLRFSRLYPLHLFTLILVAVEQFAYFRIHDSYFIYSYNDLHHFILNLFLISSVGLEKGFSFNGPTWSVSVEAVLYVAFFAFCRFTKSGVFYLASISALGFLVLPRISEPLGRGVASFFLGGLVFHGYLLALKSGNRDGITRAALAVTVVLWAATLWFSYGDYGDDPTRLLRWAISHFPAAILFPMTILSLALAETRRGSLWKRLSPLGDISYSSYLWHFPLQLLLMLTAPLLGVTEGFFRTPWALLIFFSFLIAVSMASYRYFEMPIQRQLRRMWRTAGAGARGGHPAK